MKKYYPKNNKDEKVSKAETLIQHRLVAKRYMIKMVIRQDEMSVDHLAYDRDMDRNVSLKVIPLEVAKQADLMALLKKQTDEALLLADDNIARLYNLETWKDLTYAIYEYIPGSSLSHLLNEKGGKLSPDEAIPLLRQIASALDFAHSKPPPIVHADLKPSNILLTESGVVKIADFGVARVFSDTIIRVSASEDPATFGYKAPEQISGREVVPATDVYALAAIAYEVISGKPPFTEGDLRSQILSSAPKKIDGVSEDINRALLCGLSKKIDDRPQTASDLVAMMAGEKPVPEPVSETGPSLPDTTPETTDAVKAPDEKGALPAATETQPGVESGAGAQTTRKSKTPLIIAACLLLVLLAGAGLFLSQKQPAPTSESATKPAVVTADEKKSESATGGGVSKTPETGAAGTASEVAAPPAGGIKIERPPIGDIAVNSDPSGATVYLDDKKMGATPITLRDIVKGSHQLRLTLDGFDTWEKDIEIFPLKRSELTAELESIYGGLEVMSEPSGATVLIDGKKVGATPFRLDRVKKGERQIVVEKSGYEDWRQKIKIASGESIKLFAEMGAVYGTLVVESTPEDADVYLSGRKQGKTPLTVDRVKEGSREIVIRKEGYLEYTKEVTISPGKTVILSAELDVAHGDLIVSSEPKGADVMIDGKASGKTPLTLRQLKSGRITVEVGKPCYESVIRKIMIPAGSVAESSFELKTVCGEVAFTTDPADAKFFFNGKYRGQTPDTLRNIEKGKYTVQITKDTFKPYNGTVTVAPGTKAVVDVKLDRVLPKPGERYEDPVTGMPFVWVKNGCFKMGSPPNELGRDADEEPLHTACVDGFWIGIFEVTQAEWKKVMGYNPSFFNKGSTYPVENISWNDVQIFIKKLNQMNGGKTAYRLPTEAEWAYACRSGGKDEMFSGGNQAYLVAWYKRNSKRTTHTVGKKLPNGLGLYDMSGNVYEWCADVYFEDAYKRHQKQNPVITSGGSQRVCRGGSWFHPEKESRCANRNPFDADTPYYHVGFRLVKEL